MKYMCVVECVSSGRAYIDDIISKGYRPLVVNVHGAVDDVIHYREVLRKELEGRADFIDEDPDFDAFIEKLRGYDIRYVFPGSEPGVRLADRIAAALGLVGNDPATTYLRCTKAGMDEALTKAGIRRIMTARITCEEDLVRFWNDNRLDRVVLKYSEASGTVGLKVCDSKEYALDCYRHMVATPGNMGTDNWDILAQEYIGGTEYIVNTLSCDGRHILTDIWVYHKVLSDDGNVVYDSTKLIKELNPGHSRMVRYIYRVLDAVDMKWGICHSEVKIDSKGPVLIETNARPMGIALTARYLDEALGYHPTDLAVEAYMHPWQFDRLLGKVYSPRKYALIKLMVVPERIRGDFEPTFVFSNMIRSAREVLFFGKSGVAEYQRTIDLETSPLAIKMINSDYGALMRDYELLRLIEINYFHLFYTNNDRLKGVELRTDLDAIMRNLDPIRKIKLVTDEGEFIVHYGERTALTTRELVDGAVYARCGACKVVERYESILKTMHDIRSGGAFIAVPESYSEIRDGSVMMDFLMNIADVTITAPFYLGDEVVCGIKR